MCVCVYVEKKTGITAVVKLILTQKVPVFLPNMLILYRPAKWTGWQAALNNSKIIFLKCVRSLNSAKYCE